MNQIALTRFTKRAKYHRNDEYHASIETLPDQLAIDQLLHRAVMEIAGGSNATCWSFGKWRGGDSHARNLIENHAVVLEYPTEAAERLAAKLDELGWTYIVAETETRTRNTLSIIFPLTMPISKAGQYARIASILATQIDEYLMEHGCLAPTHIIQAHRTTTVGIAHGRVLDPQAFIKATEHDYQRLDATKFEGVRRNRATVHVEQPVFTQDDTGLFAFPETADEKRNRHADELLASVGVVLPTSA